MEIAKKITGEYFLSLDLSMTGKDWPEAVNILQKRINERFIEPADLLIDHESHLPAIEKKYGFTILALDCMLCETIQSFYDGVPDSSGKSKELFSKFLLKRRNFAPFFSTKEEAEEFYYSFRCSLLHQAQTTKNTKIWSVGPLIVHKSGEVTVNRLKFHDAIKEEFNLYLESLLKMDDTSLLNNFKIKMNYIAAGK